MVLQFCEKSVVLAAPNPVSQIHHRSHATRSHRRISACPCPLPRPIFSNSLSPVALSPMTAPSGGADDDIAGLVEQTLTLLNSEGSGEGGYSAAMLKLAAQEATTELSPRDTDVGDLDSKPLPLPITVDHPLDTHESEVPLGSAPASPEGRMQSVVLSPKGAMEISEAAVEDEMLVLAGMPASPTDDSQREEAIQWNPSHSSNSDSRSLHPGGLSQRASVDEPDDLPQAQQPANGFVRIWVKEAEKVGPSRRIEINSY